MALNDTLKPWFQVFRAQSMPATLVLILLPYLYNTTIDLKILIIALFACFLHYFSYGHNSLVDYHEDLKDPSKVHHPLITGKTDITKAHIVIHWGWAIISTIGIFITISISPSPLQGVISLFLFTIFAHAYNDGLSKTTIFAFIPIAICFTSLSAWAWFLSHSGLDLTGWTLLAYLFMVIVFQISISGCLKELEIKEKSNLMIRYGAKIDDGIFKGGFASFYGLLIKIINLVIGAYLLWLNYSVIKMVWFVFVTAIALYLTYELLRTRKWNRERTLFQMSLQEIAVIYLPIPILLDPLIAITLMSFGVIYFFGMNKWLWAKEYPAV